MTRDPTRIDRHGQPPGTDRTAAPEESEQPMFRDRNATTTPDPAEPTPVLPAAADGLPVNPALPAGYDEPGHPMFTPEPLRPFYTVDHEEERTHWEVNGLPRVATTKVRARYAADPDAFAQHIGRTVAGKGAQRRAMSAGATRYVLSIEETKEAATAVTRQDREQYLHRRRLAAAAKPAEQARRARDVQEAAQRDATCVICRQETTDVLPTGFDSQGRARTFHDGHHPPKPVGRLCGPCRRVREDQLGQQFASQTTHDPSAPNRHQLVAQWFKRPGGDADPSRGERVRHL